MRLLHGSKWEKEKERKPKQSIEERINNTHLANNFPVPDNVLGSGDISDKQTNQGNLG